MTQPPSEMSVALREVAEIVQHSQAARVLPGDPRMDTLIGGPMSGWRDISSAPRDGTHILVTEAHRGGLGHCGPINKHGFRSLADWCDVVHWFDDPDEPGFYSTSWGGDQEHPFNYLTHWMPLPDPPSSGEPSPQSERASGQASGGNPATDEPHHPSTQESENG